MEHALAAFMIDPAHTAIVVDFDGTLAAIVDDPEHATAVAHGEDVLRVLAERVAVVAVVSGRPLAFLREAFPNRGSVELFGIYGIARECDGAATIDPRVTAYVEVLDAAAEALRRDLPGLRIENKGGHAVTVHWREQPDSELAALDAATALAATCGLQMHRGRMSVELRAPVEITKATTVTEIAGRSEIQRVIIAGDDQADLEACDALDALVAAGALTAVCKVAVRSAEGPARLYEVADVTAASPTAVVELLEHAARLAGEA